MPIYAYRCQDCNEVMEVFHRGKVEAPAACEKCGAEKPQRILSTVSAHVVSSDSASGCPTPTGMCGMETGMCGGGGCAFN